MKDCVVLACCIFMFGGCIPNDAGIHADALVLPTDEIVACDSVLIRCEGGNGQWASPFALEVFDKECEKTEERRLIFEGDDVYKWMGGKKYDFNGTMSASDMPWIGTQLRIATNRLEAVGRAVCFGKSPDAPVSIVKVDDGKKAGCLGTISGPAAPSVLEGMGFREARFAYLDYPKIKDVAFYVGFYSSPQGGFAFLWVTKNSKGEVLGVAVVKGTVAFGRPGQIKNVTVRNFGEENLDAKVEIMMGNDKRCRLYCVATIRGTRKGMSFPVGEKGWLEANGK